VSHLGQHDGDGIRYAMHLSAPKGGSAQMLRDPAGGWVSWEDYARLKALTSEMDKTINASQAECRRLKAEVEEARKISGEGMSVTLDLNNQLLSENARLKAEVERLTKAGDALAGKAIRLEYNDYWSEYEKVEDVCIDEVEAWHKAKEVQS
jgi:uncharacterized small protein (DUF1192 family)